MTTAACRERNAMPVMGWPTWVGRSRPPTHRPGPVDPANAAGHAGDAHLCGGGTRGLRMAHLPRLVFSYRRNQSDTAACSVSSPPLIVLAVVRVHLATPGKQGPTVQTLKAMI